ncbi:hypothetical protein MMC21_005055 [Puttea exsequens]|nr:hypothetical protein [Puttea exsequens]
MLPRPLDPNEYELVERNSEEFDSDDETFGLDEEDFQSHGLTSAAYLSRRRSRIPSIFSKFYPQRMKGVFTARNRAEPDTPKALRYTSTTCGIYRPSRRLCSLCSLAILACVVPVLFTAVFLPSYTRPPAHYHTLRQQVERSEDYGSANPENQQIFIAASIYDEGGKLLGGAWADAVLSLIDILGNRNVYLSIYETAAGELSQTRQYEFERRIQCQHSVIYEDPPPLDDFPQITMPDGSKRTKRIAYLAEARNKALEPMLEDSKTKYDKLLFLNDVIFDPIEAAQLLLSTNLDEHGHTVYRAACAVDFMNSFKFYDTYASRDLEGFSMGVPFFPWFTNAGHGYSRADVLAGKDAVRVKSCWGGMVAFDAKPFQADPPLLFRASEDLYWDASECCLIHADLINQGTFEEGGSETGIYMNPYVRVAYDTKTLSWLPIIKRFERVFTIPHNVINHLVGLPWLNPRRMERAGTQVEEKVWIPDKSVDAGGKFQTQSKEAAGDGYCGIRMLQLMKETSKEGEKKWEIMPVPPG